MSVQQADPALREVALRHLRNEFPRVEEELREDMASAAYVRMLELQESGEDVRKPEALIKKIAKQRMLDALARSERRSRASDVDLTDPSFEVADPSAERSEDSAERAIREVRVAAVVSAMSDRDKAIYVLKVDRGVTNAEGARELGMAERTYKRHFQKCFAAIDRALEPLAFTAIRRKAAITYLTEADEGGEAWERARDLVEHDPETREFTMRLLQAHKRVAGSIDIDIAHVAAAAGGVLAAVGALLGRLRPWGDGGASASAAAGGGGGGLVAAAGGSKLLTTCAAGVVCIGGGAAIIESQGDDRQEPRPERRAVEQVEKTPAPVTTANDVARLAETAAESPVTSAPQTSGNEESQPDDGGRPGHPDPETEPEPVAQTDTEAASSEFDPTAEAVAPAPAPAPAPSTSDGSGGSSGTPSGGSTSGTSSSAASEEFGP